MSYDIKLTEFYECDICSIKKQYQTQCILGSDSPRADMPYGWNCVFDTLICPRHDIMSNEMTIKAGVDEAEAQRIEGLWGREECDISMDA